MWAFMLKESLILTKKEVIEMKAPSLKQQYFGDLNRMLNNRRRQMNSEIKEKMLEEMSKNRENKEKKEEIVYG